MPRYFFHLRHDPGSDGLAVDLEGDELADVPEARKHALWSARDLIGRAQSHSVRDWFVCSFEVTDTDGRLVLTMPFGDTVVNEGEGE